MAKSNNAPHQFFAFTLFLLSWQSIKSVRGEGAEEIEYDYEQWSSKGPEHWGELKEEWKECKNGDLQSPIDLIDSNARRVITAEDDLSHLTMSYKPSPATMKLEGHDISIEFTDDAGSIHINGTDYFLKKCHWHRSSEHHINGRSYDLELHMVHQSQDKNVAVVAFLYQTGEPDPFLSKISDKVGTKEADLGVTDPSSITWPSSQFYRYIGSLTTPPCTGGVIWTVNNEVHTVSAEQLELIEEVDQGVNARPLQPLNDRDVTLFGAQ
ncbi:alpha carbonic anhydrase 4-like [Argentina anserina]|uniref:alpha carbonic anhydrase 4-like n=1 Tax=Argentina anserina TaxID=57926 RepID=UPI0021766ADA|nr:alpha carbonic anhydrase 4-like [Potentilla anserina]